jgi:hypothetical protein
MGRTSPVKPALSLLKHKMLPSIGSVEKLTDRLSEPKERQDNSDNDDQPNDIDYAVHCILLQFSRKTTEF